MAWETSGQKEAWCYEAEIWKNQIAAGAGQTERTAGENWLIEEG